MGAANNAIRVTLTPAQFDIKYVRSLAPLRLVSRSGAPLKEVMTLEEAVEASSDGSGARLHASRSFDDDLVALRGFVSNSAAALEQKSTRALAADAGLVRVFGELQMLNAGEVVQLALQRPGTTPQELAPDGLLVSRSTSTLIFNSVKHSPSLEHVEELLEDAAVLRGMLAAPDRLDTQPLEAAAQLRGMQRVQPFLSGDNFSAGVEALCRDKGVGTVRPSGAGFAVAL